MTSDPLRLGGVSLACRLIHGTGKFPSAEVLASSIEAAGAEMITLAVRRLHLEGDRRSELEGIDLTQYRLLPNTAGARSADEAIRLARLSRASGLSDFIKVEVVGEDETLLPDPLATVQATLTLVEDGFTVMPYASDDVALSLRLAEAGAAAVMPGGAPIGSTLGILNPHNIRLIIEKCSVPVIVDAGLGAPSEAMRAMEWGAAGVLVNTGIARAGDPVAMARCFSAAVAQGREAYLAGLASDRGRRPGFGASSSTDGIPEPQPAIV